LGQPAIVIFELAEDWIRGDGFPEPREIAEVSGELVAYIVVRQTFLGSNQTFVTSERTVHPREVAEARLHCGRQLACQSVDVRDNLLHPDNVESELSIKVKRDDKSLSFRLETVRASDLKLQNYLFSLPISDTPPSSGDYTFGFSTLQSKEKPLRMIVSTVSYPSPAFDAGLLLGDFLIRINGTPVEKFNRAELNTHLTPEPSKKISLEIQRHGKRATLQIAAEEYSKVLDPIGRRLGSFGPIPHHCAEPSR